MRELKSLLQDPESSYMSAEQLEIFRSALLARRQVLMSRIESRRATISTVEMASDQADQGSLEEERSLNLRFLNMENNELKSIGAALTRIADGTYGWCEDTGEPIGLPRLIHNMTAVFSADAQTAIESRSRHLAMAGAY